MTIRPALLALAAAMLAAGGAEAASFDCTKAATATEHAICDNPQISTLDEQTAGLYYTLISNGSLKQAQLAKVKNEQNKFLSRRDSCGANYNCLIDAYTAEVTYLKDATPPPTPPPTPTPPAQ